MRTGEDRRGDRDCDKQDPLPEPLRLRQGSASFLKRVS